MTRDRQWLHQGAFKSLDDLFIYFIYLQYFLAAPLPVASGSIFNAVPEKAMLQPIKLWPFSSNEWLVVYFVPEDQACSAVGPQPTGLQNNTLALK